jgi:hypothetical protein
MNEPVRIGKNVIETLTLGMYEDSRFIFREYVQNAADAIDKAVKNGLYKNIKDANIYINIDSEKHQIIIEDDGIGIESNKVLRLLGSIAESQKDRTKEKGFRGIGRLGGLGYCDKLTFETSYKGETIKSIMTWDAKKLKEILTNHEYTFEAAQVISVITNYDAQKEKSENHYFRVILDGVTNDDLLDKKTVTDYLSIVAPLAFSVGFIFKSKIKEELKKDGLHFDEYNLAINTEQIYKPYKTRVKRDNKDYDIDDIEFYKEYDNEGKILFWCWYGISDAMSKQIEDDCIFRGLRLRKYNIQIGKEDCLNEFFKQYRSNNYFIGEVHTFNSDLIPSMHKDYFENNSTYNLFKEKLKRFFQNDLSNLYQNVAVLNTLLNQKNKYNELVEELKRTKNKSEIKILSEKINTNQKSIEKYKKQIEKISKNKETESAIVKIISKTDILNTEKKLNVKNIEQDIYDILYRNLEIETAEIIKHKIETMFIQKYY